VVEQAARKQADDNCEGFLRLRDEALFHGMLFIGVDLPGNLQIARAAGDRALALLSAMTDREKPVRLSRYLNERQKAEVLSGAYELLWPLAEGAAQEPGPPAARLALRDLDRAAGLGPPTRTYHLRRARYLARLGDT